MVGILSGVLGVRVANTVEEECEHQHVHVHGHLLGVQENPVRDLLKKRRPATNKPALVSSTTHFVMICHSYGSGPS